jgi:hypothetical protein
MQYRHKNPVVQAVRIVGSRAGVSGLFDPDDVPSWLANWIAKGRVRVKKSFWTEDMRVQILLDDGWYNCNPGDWLLEDDGDVFCFDHDAFAKVYEPAVSDCCVGQERITP